MAFDMDALFRKEALSSLGPERMRLFKQFARDIEGKGIPEIAGMYMKLNQQISKEKPLTPAERGAIIDAIRESLPEADRAKFGQILRMMNIR